MTNRTSRLTPALVVCLASSLYAQDYRGRLQGVVSDPSGAAVASATVTLQNVNTKNVTVRNTSENGRYLFDFVEPGPYTVTSEAAGFGKYMQENVQVLVRSDLTVNMTMKLGDVNQT